MYARLRWTFVHDPWDLLPPEDIREILANPSRMLSVRQPGDTPEESNAAFEQVSYRAQLLMEDHEHVYDAFQEPYEWPVPSEHCGSKVSMAPPSDSLLVDKHDKYDKYWDSLFSQEALSPSSWACASMSNGSLCLFRGPWSLLMEGRERITRMYRPATGPRHPAWGFDRFQG